MGGVCSCFEFARRPPAARAIPTAREGYQAICILRKLDIESGEKDVYRGEVLSYRDGQIGKPTRKPQGKQGIVGSTLFVKTEKTATLKIGQAVAVMCPKWGKTSTGMKAEAAVMQAVTHDNFIQLYAAPQVCEVEGAEAYQTSRNMFMVLEEVKPLGYDLVTYWENCKNTGRPVPVCAVRAFVSQLADALDHLHRQKIVHRDLKPDNVLLTTTNKVKLIDFGYASTPDNEGQSFGGSSYHAPEVDTDKFNPSIDLWGVGVIIHFLCLGSYAGIATKITPAYWDACAKTVNADLVSAMKGLLSVNADERWTLADLRNAFPKEASFTSSGTIITRWVGESAPVFHAVLPRKMQETMLKDLKLNTSVATLLMTDCRSDGFNLQMAATAKVKPEMHVYLGIKDEAQEDAIKIGVFEKMMLDAVAESARGATGNSFFDKLIDVARDSKYSWTTFDARFDVFDFPDHCAGAFLGGLDKPKVLDLRSKFNIPLAAIARAEDGTVVWWPNSMEVLKHGDKGLVIRPPDVGLTTGVVTPAVTLDKVEALHDEKQFREKMGLSEPAAWQKWMEAVH